MTNFVQTATRATRAPPQYSSNSSYFNEVLTKGIKTSSFAKKIPPSAHVGNHLGISKLKTPCQQ